MGTPTDPPGVSTLVSTMFETWNPTTNPVHFIIELADVLAGSYLRFTSARADALPAARVEFNTVQDGVMVWADLYGHERGMVVNRAVAWLVNEHHARGLTPDTAAILDIIGNGILNALEAMCQLRPAVHGTDIVRREEDPDVREYRAMVYNAQSGGWRNLRRARADLFALLARIGHTVPACIEGRNNQPGPLGVVTFRDLPPVVPVFDAERQLAARSRPEPPAPRAGYEGCDTELITLFIGGATTAAAIRDELKKPSNKSLRLKFVAAWKKKSECESGVTESRALSEAVPTFVRHAQRLTARWATLHGRVMTAEDLDTDGVQT